MLKSLFVSTCLWAFSNIASAQSTPSATVFVDTFQTEQFLNTVENALFEYYKETWGTDEAYTMLNEFGVADKSAKQFNDKEYELRFKKIANETPFNIPTNAATLKTVKYFVQKRSRYMSVIIGRSKLYFPMFEAILTKHNLPLELKYLPIIESALQPISKSWAGATGLWQIMYRTGRSLNLYADSYVDDRLHPQKATEAACKYLKYLYSLYGDWELALSAYNCGPGNVNKAIRRAGNKTNYWSIRPYLPKETQQYVPNFYAMLYLMTYYKSHQIIPKPATVYFHEIDTICLKQSIRISHLDTFLNLSPSNFRKINPQYKTDIIPHTEPAQCIALPIDKLTAFFSQEEKLYNYQSYLDSTGKNYVILEKKKTHLVQPEETFADIASLYQSSPQDIREWNGLRNSKLFPGQKLIVMEREKRTIQSFDEKNVQAISKTASTKSKPTNKISSSGSYKYYTLKSGENLWSVSQKLGIPFVDIQALNSDLNPKRMKPGQKIKIGRL